MKFQLAINLERMNDGVDMRDVARHTLEMVQLADQAGFNIVWAAEHHALEMTIAPNPFQILTWWAGHTDNIRLGTAVAVAAYWHPINLAGEAAMTDLLSGGRLEFGIGSGAYQREFDRMHPGLKQSDAYKYMNEMLPAVKALWAGDYEHNGEFWSFPTSTSVPKPVQKPHPPIWIAARSPITFDYAVKNNCHVMSWPLTRPFAEAELYRSQLDEAIAAYPDASRPTFAMMRHTALYRDDAGRDAAIRAIQTVLGQFENLFRNLGDVNNGFPKQIPLEELADREQYNADMLEENLMFGTPEQVIAKLKRYEALGVDEFIYYASMGLGQKEQKKSMELFCKEVMPAFR
ncbi:MAG: LLM class flavin-dependent oxidoreductase [Gammaproteobacteria bacterium]|nr:LLM class flavin-dependent oxidoreductase [Gammaproteobacteria bacterium]MDH3447795.1 LLM class flavin-dependent oxidoreductase [Gammaproteobacteria bacterium]